MDGVKLIMRWEALNEMCTFAFDIEFEAVFGVLALLTGEEQHQMCTEIYGAEKVSAWQRTYRFLFETFQAVSELSPLVFFDILLDMCGKDFSLESFKAYILSLPKDERLFRQAEWEYTSNITKKDIKKALTDDKGLETLYIKLEKKVNSFLGFASFVQQNDRFIEEYFSLAHELKATPLKETVRNYKKNIDSFRAELTENLKTLNGLECSQKLMGKTFKNRGPYKHFYFVATFFFPYKACRFFYHNGKKHNIQLLFYSIRETKKNHDNTIAALKALSDETRYQILVLLAKTGTVTASEIAQTLKLAPSTVSHHMNELKTQGFITEEQVKTAKYYGLSVDTLKELLKTIEQDLLPQPSI